MLEPYPLASQYALDWIILFKSDQYTPPWYVSKDNRQCQRRQQEEHIQLPVLNNIDKRVVQIGIFLVCSNSFCFAHRLLLSYNQFLLKATFGSLVVQM